MGSISERSSLLYFDFRFGGQRCREYTKLNDTPANRRKMEAVLKRIESDIALNTFDYARYFPNSPMVARLREEAASSDVPADTVKAVAQVPATPLLNDFVPIWKDARQVEWRHNYRLAVDSMLKSHLLPVFGETPIAEIDRASILAFRARLAERRICKIGASAGRPLTATTLNRIMGILRQILDEGAARYDFVNPSLKIKRLKTQRIDIQPFTMAEVQQILDTVRKDYRPYLTVRFFTGMRSSEAHGLKWKHIDFERRELLIRETYDKGRTEYTKNDGSQREIQMSKPVIDALLQIRGAMSDPETYVFHSKYGNPIDNKNFNDRVWSPLLRHLDLKRRRPYQMRHTCATFWLAAGEQPQWIARQLGHTTTEMLFRTYSRYVPNLTRNDGSAFDRLVTGAVNGGVGESVKAPSAAPALIKARKPRKSSASEAAHEP